MFISERGAVSVVECVMSVGGRDIESISGYTSCRSVGIVPCTLVVVCRAYQQAGFRAHKCAWCPSAMGVMSICERDVVYIDECCLCQ